MIQTQWHGPHALTLTYADGSGRTGQQLLYRRDEERLTVEPEATAWSLDADGHLFRLASEAKRISLTATPHSGKEDEFELFMALLDPAWRLWLR